MKRSMLFAIMFILLSLSGCATPTFTPAQPLPQSTSQPVAMPPTSTAILPTETPAIPATATDIPGPWKVVHQIKVHFNSNIAGFLDDRFGISVGDGGVVHYTMDGGKTWPAAQNSSLCRFALDILDEKVAWHCGNSGSLGLSLDGGKTWQKTGTFGDLEPDQCLHLSFLDTNTGWAATATRLGATADGGKSWTELNLPKGLRRNILAIFLRTASDGYLLDSKGALWVTSDAGKNWSSLPLELKEKESIPLSAPTAAIHFFDAKRGMVVAVLMTKGEKSIVAMHTSDGGQSWQREQIPGLTWASLFLAPDGVTLTATVTDMQITVLRYQP